MVKNPLHNVAVVGYYITKQARALEGQTSQSITLDAIRGVLENAALSPSDLDGLSVASGAMAGWSAMAGGEPGMGGTHFAYMMRVGPAWTSSAGVGIGAILEAANAIACGNAIPFSLRVVRLASSPSGARWRPGPDQPANLSNAGVSIPRWSSRSSLGAICTCTAPSRNTWQRYPLPFGTTAI